MKKKMQARYDDCVGDDNQMMTRMIRMVMMMMMMMVDIKKYV